MASTRTLVRCTPLVVLLAMVGACQRSVSPAPVDKDLDHFEGVIDNSEETYDAAKSDLYVRASRLLEAGDAKEAEALYREAIAKYPNDPAGHESLGACLYFQEKYEDAKSEYCRALQLNAKSVDALYGLGSVAYKEDRYAAAEEYLEQALALNEKNAACHRVLGMVYDARGDKPKAVFHYERAIQISPRYADDDYLKGRLHALKQ